MTQVSRGTGKTHIDNEQAAAQRPKHPDFWGLSEICIGQDEAVADTPIQDLLRQVIDLESLVYVAEQRAGNIPLGGASRDRALAALEAAWIDGFMAGVKWGKR